MRAFGRFERVRERIASVRSSENGAANSEDTGYILGSENSVPIVLDETVEAVFEADHRKAAIGRGLHDGSDHRVEARGVTASSEHTNLPHSHHRSRVGSRSIPCGSLRL